MAIERLFAAVVATPFTANGTASGIVTIADTAGFKVKMNAILKSDTLPEAAFQVKRVISKTQLILGPSGGPLHSRADITAFTTFINTTIEANEQPRPDIPLVDLERASYAEEPTVAKRVFNVDEYGNPYTVDNPMPTRLPDGSVNIGTVNAELEVQLSRRDNNPDAGDVHDSVRIGNQDGELSYTFNDDESKLAADVNILNKLIDIPHDDIEVVQFTADGDPEIIEIREGGTLKRTLTLSYNADGEFQRVVRT